MKLSYHVSQLKNITHTKSESIVTVKTKRTRSDGADSSRHSIHTTKHLRQGQYARHLDSVMTHLELKIYYKREREVGYALNVVTKKSLGKLM